MWSFAGLSAVGLLDFLVWVLVEEDECASLSSGRGILDWLSEVEDGDPSVRFPELSGIGGGFRGLVNRLSRTDCVLMV
jgi:hypothetical protein